MMKCFRDFAVRFALAAILLFSSLTSLAGAQDILYEWWTGTNTTISSLTSLPDYPDNPAGVEYLNIFEHGSRGDSYGSRTSGVLIAPETGDYTFWLSTDDNGELWLSQDGNPGNWFFGGPIASISDSHSDWNQWDKYPSQQSAPVSLEQGKRYYIEALQAELGGGDHVQVRWQTPTGSPEIIPGAQVALWFPISVWVEAATATVPEAAGQTDAFIIYQSGATDPVVVNITRNTGSAQEGGGSDFTYGLVPDISGNTVTIPAGQESVVITVEPVDDIDPEADETVIIEVLPDGYAIGSQNLATVTIVDDDAPGDFLLLAPLDGDREKNQGAQIILDWEDSSPVAASYALVVADNRFFTSPYAVEETSLGTTSSYNINGGVLSQDKTYYWKVTATNLAGDKEASNNPFSFMTLDTIDPTVSGTSPRPDASDVDVTATVRVYFDELMKPDNMLSALSVVDSAGNPVTGDSVHVDSSLTFTPTDELKYNETYTVTLVPAGLVDLAGNELQSGTTFSFTTFKELAGFGRGGGCVPGGAALGLAGAFLLAAAAAFARRPRRS